MEALLDAYRYGLYAIIASSEKVWMKAKMAAQKTQNQDKYIIRMPDGMRDEIKAAAESNGRSMNAEIISRLTDDGWRDEKLRLSQETIDRLIQALDDARSENQSLRLFITEMGATIRSTNSFLEDMTRSLDRIEANSQQALKNKDDEIIRILHSVRSFKGEIPSELAEFIDRCIERMFK